ncbi:GNAT family N-acetyltransferase [Cytobacillus oceanisediminis]|uniref:GNAT family N-acetyltransferase n=1 Tax=Cytobacillus oceanisediminis TaxID=665099 RepID=UPI001CCAFBFE|nr:GNAT family N-acetyltransferase [Cytobacillus oceanisediminis]MBZ9535358.1 GNAT family N-acetyltransferase [Cytobacillus oceanisediminis]
MKPYMIREVTAKDEIQMVVVFQDLIWGKKNTMPFPFLVASLHNGGIIIGAFLKKELVGFCYGFPGFHQNEVYLVSHMMAVKDKERNAGLGFKMKIKQKELALERGYKKIIWTFDPLESRNAFLNIAKLGGAVKTYYSDHYGIMDDELNSGLPSDRFLLEWSLKGKSVNNIPAEEQIQSIVTWEMAADIPVPLFVVSISKKAEFYKVPVPNNIHTIKERDIAIAKKWRIMLRNACNHLFEMGYIIHSFQKTNEPVNYYIVSSGKVACFSKTIQAE